MAELRRAHPRPLGRRRRDRPGRRPRHRRSLGVLVRPRPRLRRGVPRAAGAWPSRSRPAAAPELRLSLSLQSCQLLTRTTACLPGTAITAPPPPTRRRRSEHVPKNMSSWTHVPLPAVSLRRLSQRGTSKHVPLNMSLWTSSKPRGHDKMSAPAAASPSRRECTPSHQPLSRRLRRAYGLTDGPFFPDRRTPRLAPPRRASLRLHARWYPPWLFVLAACGAAADAPAPSSPSPVIATTTRPIDPGAHAGSERRRRPPPGPRRLPLRHGQLRPPAQRLHQAGRQRLALAADGSFRVEAEPGLSHTLVVGAVDHAQISRTSSCSRAPSRSRASSAPIARRAGRGPAAAPAVARRRGQAARRRVAAGRPHAAPAPIASASPTGPSAPPKLRYQLLAARLWHPQRPGRRQLRERRRRRLLVGPHPHRARRARARPRSAPAGGQAGASSSGAASRRTSEQCGSTARPGSRGASRSSAA